MTPEERQASTLADWLEAGPGAPPPEGLDLDVIEATTALRPSMAPAARVSLDDILAGVTAGPFAPHAAPLPDAAPEALPAPANVPDFGGAVAPAPLQRRQSFWGALGALAAAALVLVTVLPLKDEAMAPPEAAAPPMVEAPPAAAPAPAEPQAQSVMPLGDIAESKADLDQRRQNSGPMPLTEVTTAPPPPVAQAAPGAAPRYEDTLVLDGSYGKKQEAAAEYEKATDEADDVGGFAQNGPVGGAVAEGYATSGATARGDVSTADQAVSKESRRDRAPTSSRGAAANSVAVPAEESRSKAAEDYNEAPATAYSPPPAAPQKTATKPASPTTTTTSLASQRAAAMPADYRASWYTSLSDATLVAQLSAADATAKAAAAKGDYNAAYAAVGPFVNHADARVAQDFAGRAADYSLKAGSANAALSTIRAAKSRSSANTPTLARLWAIEGAAYEALGDTEAAQRAYAEAARLNQSR